MVDLVHVKGLSDLQKMLDELPVKMEKNILRGALRVGAKDIALDAKAHCPVEPPNAENRRLYGGYPGALRDSIRIGTRGKTGKVVAYVKVGGKTKKGADVYYAHIVEFTGAKPHVIKAKDGKALSFAAGAYTEIHHPGMQPKPFLRPALDSRAQAAVILVGNAIKARLTKQGLDTADIDVKEESV